MKNTILKCLVTMVFIALYSLIIMYRFADSDCLSCNVDGLFPVLMFPVLLGVLLYFLFAHEKVFLFKSFLKSVALAFGWLLVVSLLYRFTMVKLWNFIEQNKIITSHISKYGSYDNSVEPTVLVLCLSWLIVNIIVGLTIYFIYSKYLKDKRL